MIPFYKNKMLNRIKIKAGLALYDLLSFDKGFVKDPGKKIPSRRTLGRDDIIRSEPEIPREGLTDASVYYDCLSIIPERLTLAFIRSAVQHGASVANYTKVTGFINSDTGRITGVNVEDLLNRKKTTIQGSLVINCTGPWADATLNLNRQQESHPHLTRSEGIHIITDKICHDHIIVSMTARGRHLFMIPWRNHTLFGTTDREFTGDPDTYRVTRKSIEDFISDIKESFGILNLGIPNVRYFYGGLRPLVETGNGGTYMASRKYEIIDNEKEGIPGMITAEGGKYTTSRDLAEKVVALAGKKLRKTLRSSRTSREFLFGSEIHDINGYIRKVKKENRDFDEMTLETLVKYYGTGYREILAIARENKEYAEPINADGEILAQVIHAVRSEMAVNLRDIIFRRTGIGTLGNPGMAILKKVAACAGRELKWSTSRRSNEIDSVLSRYMLPKNG